jgi:hypothetical protein
VYAVHTIREYVLAPVLTVSARKLHLQRRVLQSNISGFQETLFACWATWHPRSAVVADVVATQTEGDGGLHEMLAGRTVQVCQDAFKDVIRHRLHSGLNKIVVRVEVREGRILLKVQQMEIGNAPTPHEQR